jgi:epoxyqueuosine reductase
VKRIGRNRFIRNVLIAIGNSNDLSLVSDAQRLLGDESPVVRGAAIWALSQLMPADEFAALATQLGDAEKDGSVNDEWQLALSSSGVAPSPVAL